MTDIQGAMNAGRPGVPWLDVLKAYTTLQQFIREDVLDMLRDSCRAHYDCPDCWYSCPKSERGCCNDGEGDECNCGADAWNAKVDALIQQIEEASNE